MNSFKNKNKIYALSCFEISIIEIPSGKAIDNLVTEF